MNYVNQNLDENCASSFRKCPVGLSVPAVYETWVAFKIVLKWVLGNR